MENFFIEIVFMMSDIDIDFIEVVKLEVVINVVLEIFSYNEVFGRFRVEVEFFLFEFLFLIEDIV